MGEFKTNYLEEFPEIRTVSIEGQTWYVFKDICEYVKELSHQTELLSYVQKEDKTTIILSDDTCSNTNIVNINGFSKIIFSIRKIPKQGKKFQRIMSLKIWLKDKEKEMNADSNEINENTYCNNEKAVQCVQNDFHIFSNDEFGSIRTVIIDDKYWFMGKDVCSVFEDSNYRRNLRKIDSEDKIELPIKDSLGRTQTAIFVNESGLYSLLFSMQPQKANRDGVSDASLIKTQKKIDKLHHFKRWVTSEVLPTIRKTGGYINNEELMINTYFGNLPDQEKFLIKGLLTNITSLQNSNKALKNENNKLTTENEALTEKCLEWADRPLINALVRAYATSLAGGYGAAWNKFKKELLYKYNIGLNARISNYEKETGRKPKTLDMLHDNEIVDATNTIVSMCNENNVKIDELLQNKAKAS